VFLLDAAHDAPDEEVLSSFLEQFYARATSIPRQILVPFQLTEATDLEAFLSGRRGGPVHLLVPQRGERRELMALATRNASETLAREQARWLADQGKTLAALEELAAALELPGPPFRIECYDISNVQGSDSVGSMVVFEEGKPRTGGVPPVQDPDGRRGERLRVAPGGAAAAVPAGTERGGGECRGAALGDAGSRDHRRRQGPGRGGQGGPRRAGPPRPAARPGLAKEREELFLPERSDPIVLPPTSSALYLVQRLRDEAHRFAITYHRDLRSKRQTHSAFDDLPGVGPKRRRALLRVFGSAKRVREAPVEQIAAVRASARPWPPESRSRSGRSPRPPMHAGVRVRRVRQVRGLRHAYRRGDTSGMHVRRAGSTPFCTQTCYHVRRARGACNGAR
jgi:excinuclease ABC subunit C